MQRKPFYRLLWAQILLGAAILLGGCANDNRWVEHHKDAGAPFPSKFEVPFNQVRESYAQEKILPRENDIPVPVESRPEVIEPEPWSPTKEPILYGIAIKDQPGFVLSPYAPDKGLVDVRGFPSGTDVRDPYTGKIMKVPFQIETKPKEQTLKNRKEETPDLGLPEITPKPSLQE